jgi:hypothetical protein
VARGELEENTVVFSVGLEREWRSVIPNGNDVYQGFKYGVGLYSVSVIYLVILFRFFVKVAFLNGIH